MIIVISIEGVLSLMISTNGESSNGGASGGNGEELLAFSRSNKRNISNCGAYSYSSVS